MKGLLDGRAEYFDAMGRGTGRGFRVASAQQDAGEHN
jgi:hypothetical protein